MGTNPTVQLETISPAMAGEWLSKNKNFRALSERRAKDLARAIAQARRVGRARRGAVRASEALFG